MQRYFTAGSIVLGSLIIAGAILFKDYTHISQPSAVQAPPTAEAIDLIDVPREDKRNLYGSPEAPTTIVEFSDFECPFCARLHPTLKRIVDESGGTINWEYRHLPLPNHSNAFTGAIASECVAQLAGQEAFWEFTEILFANIGQHSDAFHKEQALALGVTADAYDSCLSDTAVAERVQDDMADAGRLGGRGTPYSVIVSEEGSTRPVSGALPYEQWRAILNSL